MKVLQVGKYYPPYHGGMETVLENLVKGLLDENIQVNTLVSGVDLFDRQETITGPKSGNTGALIRATRVGLFHSQPMNTTLVSLLRHQLVTFKPDLVHMHVPNPLALLAWAVLSRINSEAMPPLVIWHHADITRQKFAGNLLKPFLGHCYHKSIGICVSSQALAASSSLLSNYSTKVEVIPFGIDAKPWCEIRPSHQGSFLFIGRLVPYKGLPVLLDALKLVPEATLDVVGEGYLRKSLEEEIHRHDLKSRVVFHEACDSRSLVRLMSKARALVLPSLDHSETFGLVQLEAMASGIPVIASNLKSGVSEVGVDGETCFLVTPGDSISLAKSMASILDDEQLTSRMGVASRIRFTEMFTRQKMTSHVIDWYEALLSPNS